MWLLASPFEGGGQNFRKKILSGDESEFNRIAYSIMSYPFIVITQEMIDEAKRLVPQAEVARTVASKIDTLTGHLGEFVFAQFLFNDWKKNRVGKNKGETDFENIEIKSSAFPFNEKLNLLVREDYARKRKPQYYVQIIIDVASGKADAVAANTRAYLCGYASSEEVDKAPLKDFGSKLSDKGGYRCHFISIRQLKPMSSFPLRS